MAKRKNTNLSKSTLIRSIQCQKSLYLYKNFYHLRDKVSRERMVRFNRGHDIGRLAQQLFPHGKDMSPKSPKQFQQSILATEYLISQDFSVLYEAAFKRSGIIIFLDILVNNNGKWYGYEVKGARKVTQTHLYDAAIQYYVMQRSKLELEDMFLIHVNPDYTEEEEFSIDVKDLFVEQSIKAEVLELQPYIEEVIEEAKNTLAQDDIPEIAVGPHCDVPYECDFKGVCWEGREVY